VLVPPDVLLVLAELTVEALGRVLTADLGSCASCCEVTDHVARLLTIAAPASGPRRTTGRGARAMLRTTATRAPLRASDGP